MIKYYLPLFCLLLPCTVIAIPKNVIIVRHGEKIPGKTFLAPKGYERAAALPYYFLNTPRYNAPAITHILATGTDIIHQSVRPLETCTPTAEHYKLPLDTKFKPGNPQAVAEELLTNKKYDKQTVLLCWEHIEIPKIIKALGVQSVPDWPNSVFDQTYILTFEDEKAPPTVRLDLQKLMYGDRSSFDE